MFETNEIPEIVKEARWIWPESPSWDLYNCYAIFRKAFTLAKVPVKAPLYITADQSYQLYLNGRYLCRGPARGFQEHWPYDELDLAAHLRPGRNVIAVRAHHPGFSNFQYLSKQWAGLLVAAQWGELKIRSNHSWYARRQRGISKDVVPTSLQLFCQEHLDAREEAQDWFEPDFDEKGTPPDPLSTYAWNSMPWYALEARGIPLLVEKEVYPVRLIGLGQGHSSPGYAKTRDLAALRFTEDRSHQRPAKGIASTEAGRKRFRCKVAPTGKGRFRSLLLDFGRTVVGAPVLRVQGARGGEIVDTLHVETIDEETLTPHLKMPVHCRMAFANRLVCRQGETFHRFYHPYGFRYMTVTVRDSRVPLNIDISLAWIGYPLERTGSFQHDDPELVRIWETCAWTQQCCALDAYVDTPWREQAQWWGDARVQAWNTFHLCNDARLLRRGIHCIAHQTLPNGLTYGHAPTMAHNCILPDFTLIWMLTIWDYFWQTGSFEPFETHLPVIERALDYFAEQTDPRNGLLRFDPRYWLFLDWTKLPKDGCSSVYSLWAVYCFDRLAGLYDTLGHSKQVAALHDWSARKRGALRQLLDQEGLLRDGYDPQGKPIPSTSIHAQTLAILTELDPARDNIRIERILLPYLRGTLQPEITPSAYWITYLFTVLAERGHGGEVLRFIREHWLPMTRHGTTWENFKPEVGNESHSHAWSAHPLFHLMQILGGIRQTDANWRQITFQPLFEGKNCRVCIPIPRGRISSEWRRTGERVQVKLKIPSGVRARVLLPGKKPFTITESRSWKLRLPDPEGPRQAANP